MSHVGTDGTCTRKEQVLRQGTQSPGEGEREKRKKKKKGFQIELVVLTRAVSHGHLNKNFSQIQAREHF